MILNQTYNQEKSLAGRGSVAEKFNEREREK